MVDLLECYWNYELDLPFENSVAIHTYNQFNNCLKMVLKELDMFKDYTAVGSQQQPKVMKITFSLWLSLCYCKCLQLVFIAWTRFDKIFVMDIDINKRIVKEESPGN